MHIRRLRVRVCACARACPCARVPARLPLAYPFVREQPVSESQQGYLQLVEAHVPRRGGTEASITVATCHHNTLVVITY